MGKASRMKKERKEQGSARIARGIVASHGNQADQTSANAYTDMQAFISQLGGGNLIVIDGNGIALGEEEAQRMYWTEVCEGIHNFGASCLPEMVALGRLMNLSIFDVEVPIFEEASGQHNDEDILTAMFLLGHMDSFQWLLSEAIRTNVAWRLLGQVFKNIVSASARLGEETPQMAMAKTMVRSMAEASHANGCLEKGMADPGTVMGQPFARRIAQDYLEELAAAEERAELEAVINLEERVAEAGGLRL